VTLLLGLLFGAVGGIYLALGRRNHDATWLVTGFSLIVYPYFFSSVLMIVLIGLLLCAVPIARDKGLF
jgi:ABC-type dipeptide/oligopeptide/nickel transport system permease component